MIVAQSIFIVLARNEGLPVYGFFGRGESTSMSGVLYEEGREF